MHPTRQLLTPYTSQANDPDRVAPLLRRFALSISSLSLSGELGCREHATLVNSGPLGLLLPTCIVEKGPKPKSERGVAYFSTALEDILAQLATLDHFRCTPDAWSRVV